MENSYNSFSISAAFVIVLTHLVSCPGCSGEECPSGLTRCGEKCVDLMTNIDSCGNCTTSCADDKLCVQGTCKNIVGCEDYWLNVCTIEGADACVDISVNPNHCGNCGVKCREDQVCRGGVCTCYGSDIECYGECVNPMSNTNHCGGCVDQNGYACDIGDVCVNGLCIVECPGTMTICGRECVNLDIDWRHCGQCSNTCDVGAGLTCHEGLCICAGGSHLEVCGDLCVNTYNDPLNCGGCDQSCNVSESCVQGACTPAECEDVGLTTCDGICVDIEFSNDNCGGCADGIGEVCDISLGFICQNGQCLCAGNLEECFGECVDKEIDPKHCGVCGHSCQPNEFCQHGQCLTSCGDCEEFGSTCCVIDEYHACVNLDTNRQHCGECGNECREDETCINGSCSCGREGMRCDPRNACCNGICIDLACDPDNCGSCGNACEDGFLCNMGYCVWRFTDCDNPTYSMCTNDIGCVDYVDTRDSNLHCGSCNHICGFAENCVNSECIYGPCEDDGLTGCLVQNELVCVDIDSDTAHCGGCENACPAGEYCINGSCSSCNVPGWMECENECFNKNSNPYHCGECLSACSSVQKCFNGECVAYSCEEVGLVTCSVAGVETCVDTNHDENHCNGCNVPCNSPFVCFFGMCGTYDPCDLWDMSSCCSGIDEISCVDTTSEPSHCGECDNACLAGEQCVSGICE